MTFLKTKKGYTPTIDISKDIIGKGATAKDVNPALYRLLAKNLVIKQAEENGSKPRWKIA